MVTYFNKKDLVEFGKYLLSEERTEIVLSGCKKRTNSKGTVFDTEEVERKLSQVTHADVENFLEKIKKVD